MQRVFGALIISSALIGSAWYLSIPGHSFFKANTANAASTQQLLQEYAQKDTDNDGLPDWEEELYGTDPNNPHSVSPNVTDGEAVAQGLVKPKFSAASSQNTGVDATSLPGTLPSDNSITAQFSQTLLTQYLNQSNGTQPSATQIDSYVAQAVQQLAAQHENTAIYTSAQENVSGSGADALRTYAAKAEKAFADNTISTQENEIDYFSDAVEKGDMNALTEVGAIGSAYKAIAAAFIQVPVPTEASAAHLELANSMAKLNEDLQDMAAMKTDPLRAYLGLAQYQNDAPQLQKGFADLNAAFATDGVSISSGPGANLYQETVTASQQK